MRLLIDTHILLWALAQPERLSAAFLDILRKPNNQVLFSSASIWEIAIKAALRRTDFAARPDVVAREAVAQGFAELQVGWQAAAAVADMRPLHRDPFDRILIAQAVCEPVHLFTVDRKLVPYSDMVRMVDTR
jgi:PIN domain nuclease of toxin-antitoxin system